MKLNQERISELYINAMKKKNSKSAKNLEYDITKDNLYSAKISLGPNSIPQSIKSVKIDKLEHDGNLTFDDVVCAVDAEIEKTYPEKSYPDLEVLEYSVFCSDTEKWYPVISESDKDTLKKIKKSKTHDRYLVLPDATYHLTPEAELWLTLKNQGVYNEDHEFDFNEMHKILEIANRNNK